MNRTGDETVKVLLFSPYATPICLLPPAFCLLRPELRRIRILRFGRVDPLTAYIPSARFYVADVILLPTVFRVDPGLSLNRFGIDATQLARLHLHPRPSLMNDRDGLIAQGR